MQYKIFKRGTLVAVVKNTTEVGNIMGMTQQQTARALKANLGTLRINDMVVESTQNRMQKLKMDRPERTQGITIQGDPYTGRRTEVLSRDHPVWVRGEAEATNVLFHIQNMRPSLNTAQYSKFRGIITLDTTEGDKIVSTSYLPWDELMDKLENMLSNWYDDYGGVPILKIELDWISYASLDRQIIYGGMKDLLTEFYKKITKTTEDKKTFMKFIKNHKLGHVETKTNCFIKSVLHSMHSTEDKEDINKKYDVEQTKYKWDDEPKTLEIMGPLVSEWFSVQIHVYDDKLNHTLTYGKIYPKIVKVLIYANHSFYILDKSGEDRFIQIDEELNKQNPMENPEEKEDATYYIYGSFDCETYNIYNEDKTRADTIPWCYGFMTERHKYKPVFGKKDEDVALKFILELRKLKAKGKDGKPQQTKYVLYGHNAGKFDSYTLLYTLLKNDFTIKSFMPKDGRIIQLEIFGEVKGVTIDFRDSICLVQGKLEDLLKDFQCKTLKLTGTVDYKAVNKDNYYTDPIINMFYQYLQNDVEGLFQLIIKLKDIIKEYYDLDLHKCRTNASIARNFFFKNHDFEEYPIHTVPMESYKEFKPFYYGGRNECFKFGTMDEAEYFYYDFTSLYPYVMHKYKLPYGKYEHKKLNTNKYNKKWFGLIKIKIKSNSTDFRPYFGLKEDGKLIFKHFKEWTEIITTTPHLKNAIKNNLDYSYEFVELWHYEDKGRYYQEIIEKCYKLKTQAEQDGNEPLRQVAKIIINSQYGFWGIKFDGIQQVSINKFKTKERKTHHIEKHLNRGRLVNFESIGKSTLLYTEEELKIKGANLPIAMFVTDYARMELYNLMLDIEAKGGDVLYCDTDSIITNIKLEETELNDKYNIKVKYEKPELGNLTNETKVRGGSYSNATFLGCKSYYLEYNPETYKQLKKQGEAKKPIDKLNEMKFKGINIKQKYNIKEYDHEEKTITLKEINREHGKESVDPQDYNLMADGYVLKTDNFTFITSVKTLKKDKSIKYMENVKEVCAQYDKGVIDGKNIIPFYN